MTRQNMIKVARDWWFIVLFVAGIIITWTQLGEKVIDNSEKIEGLQTTHEALDITMLQIQTDLVEIRTSLKFIEQRVK